MAIRLTNKKNTVIAVFLVALISSVVAWGFIRKVPVKLAVEPASAKLLVDGEPVNSGEKIGFGSKKIELSDEGFVPMIFEQNFRPFSSLILETKLRSLPQGAKLADGDFLRQDNKGKIFYRSGGKIQLMVTPARALNITDEKFGSLSDIVFSPDGLLAWVNFSDGANGIYDFNHYNITGQEFHKWDLGIVATAWLPSSSATHPDQQKLIYLQDGVLYRSNPLRTQVERLLDLKGENITQAEISYAFNEKAVLLVANNNLYILEPQTKTLSQVAQGGITSAVFTPNSQAVVYSQNNELIYQKFSVVNSFSQNPEDQKNIGKILVEKAVKLGLKAESKQGSFTKNGEFIIFAGKGVVKITLADDGVANFYHQSLPDNPNGLKLFNDQTTILGIDKAIYSLNLDDGQY